MKANIKYFGMIAEKIGKTEESVDLDETSQSNLRPYFVQKYAEFVEIALLPPFAGG